jgi:type I restriction enzyme, S subunit
MMKTPKFKWKATTLGEHVDIQTGFPFKSLQYTEDSSGIRLLRGDNIVQGKLRWEGVKRWPKGKVEGYDKFFLRPDDVVLAMDRPWIEAGLKYAWITELDLPCLLVQRVSRLRGTSGLLTPYIRYILGHHSFTDYVKGIWTGVAVPHISESQIRAFRFVLPPIETQERILQVLTAYDDLIENNTRRIRILEEMAQMLYREWFVHFRFPGHEKVRMVESEMGPIPKGWSIEPISNVAEILGGGTPASGVAEYWEDGEIVWYSPSDLTAAGSMFMFDSSKRITQLGLQKSSARLFPVNSVMMTSRATIGVVAINRTPACTNQGFITCVPTSRISNLQIYFWMLENKEKIISLATGATFKEINKRTFRELPIVVASPAVSSEFVRTVSPLSGQIENLLRRSANLRTTRDLLLPKLISGEVSVENIEVEAMA